MPPCHLMYIFDPATNRINKGRISRIKYILNILLRIVNGSAKDQIGDIKCPEG